jgi:hypothetical protein
MNGDMGNLVTLLKPLTDALPWWVIAVIAVPVTIGFLVKWSWSSYWSLRKLAVETKLKEEEFAERIKKKAELGALREKEPPPSEVSDFPEFKPVSGKVWLFSIALAILNELGFVYISISEPLTSLKVALMTLSFFSGVWSLATPIFTTLLRTMTYTLKVHLWLVRFSFKEQLALMRSSFQEQADFSKTMLSTNSELFQKISDTDREFFQKMLSTDRELFGQIGKEIEEIKSLLQSRR